MGDHKRDDRVEIEIAELERLQRLASLGQAGASTVHEVRNAMTGILGFAQVARRKVDGAPALAELLTMIERESFRCLDLLTTFLSQVRGSASKRQRTDVSELVGGVERLVRDRFHDRGIRLRCELGGDLPRVKGDPDALRQVVLNLTVNALQASSAGGEVVLSTRAVDAGVEIAVEDQGEGVPEALRERIFEPFFTTRRDGEGTGLGLWICRSIVTDHGGTLCWGAGRERGSRFVVRLPGEADAG